MRNAATQEDGVAARSLERGNIRAAIALKNLGDIHFGAARASLEAKRVIAV
jgi:hypothetical protein